MPAKGNDPGWIQTVSHRRFWPMDPNPDDIDVAMIAAGLSLENRFSGQTGGHGYSVAQHSVLVSQACDPQDALWGLLHDAPEGLGLADLPRPIKYHPDLEGFRHAEARLMCAVCLRFGLPLEEPLGVQRADRVVLATEVRDFGLDYDDGWKEQLQGVEPLPDRIVPWLAPFAARKFLDRFHELTKGAGSGS